ncbi:hypothetical protein BZA05DRAFT_43468 [Tricharina praecox]|uniref:uncharacterized protein n=1 Tax=Tricharina praecox TaxID=43433 RepID=UPI00221F4DB7|nr:uncharacterized protein BZA05DRAFT_43468 [Tricharina praecox]KAI5851776.1 hypothetical protein BZA05DRAFT_43468 [Tricharina praecox]
MNERKAIGMLVASSGSCIQTMAPIDAHRAEFRLLHTYLGASAYHLEPGGLHGECHGGGGVVHLEPGGLGSWRMPGRGTSVASTRVRRNILNRRWTVHIDCTLFSSLLSSPLIDMSTLSRTGCHLFSTHTCRAKRTLISQRSNVGTTGRPTSGGDPYAGSRDGMVPTSPFRMMQVSA